MERISRVRNRMRESRWGGEGGNLLAYPALFGDVGEPNLSAMHNALLWREQARAL